MDWIKLKNKKPPLDTKILVFQQGYDVTGVNYYSYTQIAEYVVPPKKKKPIFAVDVSRGSHGVVITGFPLDEVTHWMPLPEPPRRSVAWVTKNPPQRREKIEGM